MKMVLNSNTILMFSFIVALPYKGREGGPAGTPPPPSGLFSVALKPFELMTYKFVTFPKYELTLYVKILARSIIA